MSSRNIGNEYIKRILNHGKLYLTNVSGQHYSLTPLSNREIEILSLLDESLSRKQIADKLFISQETAKTHLKNIYQKLEVSGKVAAIKIAKARGYIKFGVR